MVDELACWLDGTRRRVPGLGREEVAALAGATIRSRGGASIQTDPTEG